MSDNKKRLTDLLPEYFTTKQLRNPGTLQHYRRSIRQFGEFLGHEATTGDLKDKLLAGWMLATVDSGLTEVTANQRAKQIRALWEWAARRKYAEEFPTLKGLKEPELNPMAYTPKELQQLFAHCQTMQGWIGPRPAALWWHTLHWWLFDTAERIGATMALTWPMVDLDAGVARLPGNIRKGMKRATYRLSDKTVGLLRELREYPTEDDLVFYCPVCLTSFAHRYKRMIVSAGLPYTRGKSGPHKMRRTVLTMIECHGGDATAFAQHSSRSVTEAYIDTAMVMAHSDGDWPRGIDPEKKPGILKRIFGKKPK